MSMAETQDAPKPDRLIVCDNGPVANLVDSARFEQMKRIAIAMAHASLIPNHLHGDSADPQQRWEQTVGNCLLIVNQALRWDMDPFAVAPETYVVKGKLGYQGKLVAAVIHARGNLRGRLGYSFTGEGVGRTVTVAGQFLDEKEPRTITLSVGQAKTDNKMWVSDPDQKLVYSGVTKWARRHCPELMLGVLTPDDLDRMAISRLDGRPAIDPTTQAQPPGAEGAVTVEDLTTKQPAPEPPYDPPDVDASHSPAEPQAPQTAAEEPEPLSAMGFEMTYVEAIKKEGMIRAVNKLAEDLAADPDLPYDAIQRLQDVCEQQRAAIRSKRGLGTAPQE